MKRNTALRSVPLLAVLLAAGRAQAQELSVLDAPTTRWITQEVSGDAAYVHIRFMTTTANF